MRRREDYSPAGRRGCGWWLLVGLAAGAGLGIVWQVAFAIYR